MTELALVFDAGLADFEAKVIEGSFDAPVMVDFWATWCEPCKALGPMLERIVKDHAGAVRLAKVDIDKHPELAQAFRVQSVPTVVLIKDGQAVDAFMGAQPLAKIQEFLAQVLETELPAPVAVEEAMAAAEAGKLDAAVELLRGHLAAHADDDTARITLVGYLLDCGQAADARQVFDELPEDAGDAPSVEKLRKRLELAESAKDPEQLRLELADKPQDLDLRMDLGRALIAAGQTEEGLEELFEAAQINLGYDDGAPRKALLEVFEALGDDAPLTIDFRQRLSVLICS